MRDCHFFKSYSWMIAVGPVGWKLSLPMYTLSVWSGSKLGIFPSSLCRWCRRCRFLSILYSILRTSEVQRRFSTKCWYVGLVFLAWISAWQPGGRLKIFSGKVPWTHGCCSRWVAHKTCDARHVWRIGIHDAIPKKCNEIPPVMGSSWSWSLWKKMVLPVLFPFVVVSLESRVVHGSCPLPLAELQVHDFSHLARMKMMKVASVFSALLASC